MAQRVMLKDILSCEAGPATVDDAVRHALSILGCSRAEAETTILQTPRRGFFGFIGARPARVRLELTDLGFIARRVAEHLLRLSGLPARVEVIPGRQKICLRIHSDHSAVVIGRRGQTLDALQALVVLLTDRVTGERTPIHIDIDGYRHRNPASGSYRPSDGDREIKSSSPICKGSQNHFSIRACCEPPGGRYLHSGCGDRLAPVQSPRSE